MLQLSESTLEKAQDASLLDAIQNGLLQGLKASSENETGVECYTVAKVSFENAVDVKEMLGKCIVFTSTHGKKVNFAENTNYIDLIGAEFEQMQTGKTF